MILKLFVCGLFTCAISKCRPRSLVWTGLLQWCTTLRFSLRISDSMWIHQSMSWEQFSGRPFEKAQIWNIFFQLIRRFCAIYFKLPLGCFWNDLIKSCRRGNNDPMRRHFGKGLFVGERVTTCAANCENCSKNFDF